ncbi:MAG: Galactokinase, partial [Verrucomicrobiota bacterium]
PELDTIVVIARELGVNGGVYGCRMTGGGFGGCCVALVKTSIAKTVAEKISAEYQRRTNIAPSLFTSRPGAGATIVK